MKYILFAVSILSLSFSFTLDNMVFANSKGEEIFFKFFSDEKTALEESFNSIWIEKTDYGYDIKYDAYENIAGFQFNLTDLNEHNNYQFVNGQMQKNNFMLQKSDITILGFSFEGKVLPDGKHTLLEVRSLDYEKDKALNKVSNKDDVSNVKTINEFNIDITNIVVSDSKGNAPKINFICHKKECKDHKYKYDKNYEDNSYHNLSSDLITMSLQTKDSILWEVYYDSNFEIGGYQFDVEGAEIIDAFGGDSSKNNFTISTNNKTIIAFSFKGDSIPAGNGKLLEFKIR